MNEVDEVDALVYDKYVDYGDVELFWWQTELSHKFEGIADLIELRFMTTATSRFGPSDLDTVDSWYRLSFEAITYCITAYLDKVYNANEKRSPTVGHAFQLRVMRRLSPRLYTAMLYLDKARAEYGQLRHINDID